MASLVFTSLASWREEQLAKLFDLVDVNRRGLTVDDMFKVVKLEQHGISYDQLKSYFMLMDVNHDFRLSKQEFVAGFLRLYENDSDAIFSNRIDLTFKHLTRKPLLGKVFDEFDVDQSGYLDADEVKRMLHLVEGDVSEQRLDQVLKRLVRQGGKIQKSDFIDYFFLNLINSDDATFLNRVQSIGGVDQCQHKPSSSESNMSLSPSQPEAQQSTGQIHNITIL